MNFDELSYTKDLDAYANSELLDDVVYSSGLSSSLSAVLGLADTRRSEILEFLFEQEVEIPEKIVRRPVLL